MVGLRPAGHQAKGDDGGMRIEFWQPSGTVNVPGKGEFTERYAPHAFDGLVGKSAPFKIEGVEHGQVTVVAVEVAEDGSGATWTVEVPDGAANLLTRSGEPRGMSFSIPEIPERWWE